jgi:small ligand-binding sensory domain FIST
MNCASALSQTKNSTQAFHEITDRVANDMAGVCGTIAVAFVSAHHAQALGELDRLCREKKIAKHFLAVTGETIVGEGQEIEGAAAASLWTIRLPDSVTIQPVRLEFSEGGLIGLPAEIAMMGAANRTMLLLADPYSFPTDRLFLDLEREALGLSVVGGMASSSHSPGGNRLVLDGEVYSDGAVGLILDGPLAIRTIVSQGCRPVGRSMVVTKSEGNMIRELGRRPALEVLRETYDALSEDDQALIREGLHVGRVINEYQDSFGRGDFLIRNVMGADDSGGIAITDMVRVGQTVQFHVRDAATADEDLRLLLAQDQENHPDPLVAGGLLFSCNGRGTRLFSTPHHDARVIQSVYGNIPVAGFFAMGELGPVGGKNFVHGFTASLALFTLEG